MLRVEADSRVVKRGRGRPRKSERQAGHLTKQTRRALQATDPTPRKVGRPPKFSFEMVVEIINSVANGGSIINDLKRHNMSAMSFYKRLNDNPELSEQYEEEKEPGSVSPSKGYGDYPSSSTIKDVTDAGLQPP